MNKPAPKEPSMDEILSSIRQIIAEDDATARKSSGPSLAFPPPPQAGPATVTSFAPPVEEPTPLALSPEQIVEADELEADVKLTEMPGGPSDSVLAPGSMATPIPDAAHEDTPRGFVDADLVDGDDVDFAPEPPAPQPAPSAAVEPEPQPRPAAPPQPPPRPAIPVSRAAPMPDPTLSSDIAEQLLKPATDAAVRHTFARLGNVAVGAPGVTLEDLMRDMLRPMLKDWLDENLPSVVERMVEREIARISRGVE